MLQFKWNLPTSGHLKKVPYQSNVVALSITDQTKFLFCLHRSSCEKNTSSEEYKKVDLTSEQDWLSSDHFFNLLVSNFKGAQLWSTLEHLNCESTLCWLYCVFCLHFRVSLRVHGSAYRLVFTKSIHRLAGQSCDREIN